MIPNDELDVLMQTAEMARADLADWTIGFVKAIGEPESFDCVLAGSGVLVKGGGQHAILTAEHVLDVLPKFGPVGLVLLSRRGSPHHQFLLEMNYVQKLTFGRGTDEAAGPDLALLILSQNDVTRLERTNLFHNLEKRKTRMLDEPPANKISPWMMCGFVGEMTQNITPRPGMVAARAFKGLCGPVYVTRVREDEQFDYFSVEVNFGKSFGLPESFGGCSGSGLWRLHLSENNGKITVEEISLGGIAYYESPKEERMCIEFHGRKSIYKKVLDALKK